MERVNRMKYLPARTRDLIYFAGQILAALAACVLAVLVVLGKADQAMIVLAVQIALDLFVVFTNALARLHLTPDGGV